MSWLTFTEIFTLGFFYTTLCCLAHDIGAFVGRQSNPGSTTRVFFALMLNVYDIDRTLDDLTKHMSAFDLYLEGPTTARA